jgi:hypothetical protein
MRERSATAAAIPVMHATGAVRHRRATAPVLAP